MFVRLEIASFLLWEKWFQTGTAEKFTLDFFHEDLLHIFDVKKPHYSIYSTIQYITERKLFHVISNKPRSIIEHRI